MKAALLQPEKYSWIYVKTFKILSHIDQKMLPWWSIELPVTEPEVNVVNGMRGWDKMAAILKVTYTVKSLI